MTQMAHRLNTYNAHAKGREKLKAHLAMLLFAMLIAGSFSLGGLASQRMPSEAINALRYLIGTTFMWAFAQFVGGVKITIPREPWRYAILGLLMGTYMYTMFKALEFTSPVSTGAVFTLMPLLSAGIAWFVLRQHTKPLVLASLSIAASGAIWVIFRGDLEALLGFHIGRGEMIYFIGVICHAAFAPLLRLYSRGEPALYTGFWTVAATGAWLMLPGIPALVNTNLTAIPLIGWVAILYLAIVTTSFTFLLLQYASLRLPASKTLAYGYLTPTFIILLEGLIGHGWVSLSIWLGAAVIACGLAIMALLPD